MSQTSFDQEKELNMHEVYMAGGSKGNLQACTASMLDKWLK